MFQRSFILIMICAFVQSSPAQVEKPEYIKSSGFFVLDGKVYNADGTEFLIRGVNQNHFWGNETTNLNSLEEIPKSHANTVRVVMSNADWQNQSRTPDKKRALIEKYVANGIVPMAEQHDATCGNDPAEIEAIVDVWTLPENVDWLNEYEEFVMLNIANEWGPGDTETDWQVWRDTYKTAITRLRDAGINNLIVIDSPKCGQGPRAMEEYGQELLEHDPQHNVLFTIHMYGWWRTMENAGDVGSPNSNNPPWLVEYELQTMLDRGLPFIVGEFSWKEAESVRYDTETLIAFCEKKGIGWLAWSWNGNGDETLDMVKNFRYDSDDDLKEYGELIINHPQYGLRATATQATVFGVPNVRPDVQITSIAPGAEFEKGSDIIFDVTATDPDGTIEKVELYSGLVKLGESTASPHSFGWTNVPRGRFEMYAVAWDDAGQIGSSDIVPVNIGFRPITKEALLVVGNTDLREIDAIVSDRLVMLGYNVTLADDNDVQAEDTNGMDMVLISSTVIPRRIDDRLTAINVPIIVWDATFFDELFMTRRSALQQGREDGTQIQILDQEHPMAAGYSGSIDVYTDSERLAWGIPASSADIIAALLNEPTKAVLFAYEKGDVMIDSFSSPAARIGIFLQDDSGEVLNTTGWILIDAAIDYAQETAVKVSDESMNLPRVFELQQNHPNPFNPSTTIEFSLPVHSTVKIDVFNTTGQHIKTLLNADKFAGSHAVIWDGNNNSHQVVANGLYFYRMVATATDGESFTVTRKMMFFK